MTIPFNCVKVKHRSISNWQKPYTLHNLLGLNNGRHCLFPNLYPRRMDDIDTLIELLILLQDIDAGVYDNTPDPSLKGTPVFKSVHLEKDLDKSLLEHVLCIFTVVRIPVTNGQHFC